MDINLNFNLNFSDLYDLKGIQKIHDEFLSFLKEESSILAEKYFQALNNELSDLEQSNLLIELAPVLENFISILFNIRQAVSLLQSEHHYLNPLITVKRQFVQRYAVKKYKDISSIIVKDLPPFSSELEFAQQVLKWLDKEELYKDELVKAAQYAAWACLSVEGKKRHQEGILFKIPSKIEPTCLIEGLEKNEDERYSFSFGQLKLRQGFKLTDKGPTRVKALDQANYCIWCHHQGKDSCSKGLKPKSSEETTEPFQKNAFGSYLTGCPLEQKISETNEAKAKGYTVGALAIITIDNPMVAATGHRICNDCTKSCIYQKQDPVDIPSVETQILKDVLNLPWGFEIYSLLTRWNPLNFSQPFPKELTNKNILVAGMGPAGFTLSHYLLNQGHTVIGIDGLKIEPLDEFLSGVDKFGKQTSFEPIYDITTIYEQLDERVVGGFGGVAEYGITVRWDKNFLKIIRLLLERRQNFSLIGGVRLGGTLTIDQAFELGFDHVALCLGSGSPNLISMENSLVSGVRQASDFLMALQLSSAAKKDSIANLQVRLPIIVIGGGLTAVDTATEALAYYPIQVKKFSKRYHQLIKEIGKDKVHAGWNDQEETLATEMLGHAVQLEKAQDMGKRLKLLKEWGGATIVYRRDIKKSPAYTLNHEELEKALQEGIEILDQAVPLKVITDEFDRANGLLIEKGNREKFLLSARTILIAAGTQPNTNLRYDIPDQIYLNETEEKIVFQAVDENGNIVRPEKISKPKETHVLMYVNENKKAVSFFGDLHPSFSGNVVKAMASAKKGYPIVDRAVNSLSKNSLKDINFQNLINNLLRPVIEKIKRLTPNILELIIKAPLAAQAFQPGQFYRLQNVETLASKINGTNFAMEGIALTGAWVDKKEGLVSLIVLEMGGSSNLCSLMKPGEPIILMGPTGSPTKIPFNETISLVGGGLGNAVLFSIGKSLKQSGCRVLYFAGYKKQQDIFKREQIEQAADQVVWCCEEDLENLTLRAQDLAYKGNIVQAMEAYAKKQINNTNFVFDQIDRFIVIGSDRLMHAVTQARRTTLKPYLNPQHIAIGSINSPMQCMMKEICAQCLQLHRDPITGEEKIVYSCVNQDQSLDQVDFNTLNQRLSQNSLQEKLTNLWIKNCMKEIKSIK